MIAGLIPDAVRREWKATKNDVISLGEGVGDSPNIVWSGFGVEGDLVRVKVCRREENPLEGGGDVANWEGDGEGGRDGVRPGEGGAVDFKDPDVDDGVIARGAVFFFEEKGERKRDQSDSNCTDSNSEDNGEWSRSAASNNWSILRSAKRSKKTAISVVRCM